MLSEGAEVTTVAPLGNALNLMPIQNHSVAAGPKARMRQKEEWDSGYLTQ